MYSHVVDALALKGFLCRYLGPTHVRFRYLDQWGRGSRRQPNRSIKPARSNALTSSCCPDGMPLFKCNINLRISPSIQRCALSHSLCPLDGLMFFSTLLRFFFFLSSLLLSPSLTMPEGSHVCPWAPGRCKYVLMHGSLHSRGGRQGTQAARQVKTTKHPTGMNLCVCERERARDRERERECVCV